ncbi:hypothetical protein, partial [Pseudomonas sp. SID14000]
HTQYIAIFVAVLGVMVAAIQMAFTQRGESARDLLRSLITFGVASAFSIAIVQALVAFGDQFANCIVTTAVRGANDWQCVDLDQKPAVLEAGNGFRDTMKGVMGFSATAGTVGIGLMITIGILTLLA